MKKKKIKNLSLNKKSISKLNINGGGLIGTTDGSEDSICVCDSDFPPCFTNGDCRPITNYPCYSQEECDSIGFTHCIPCL